MQLCQVILMSSRLIWLFVKIDMQDEMYITINYTKVLRVPHPLVYFHVARNHLIFDIFDIVYYHHDYDRSTMIVDRS